MPKGVYERTEWHKSRIRGFKKGHVPWNKNRVMPQSERDNISRKLKGRFSGEKHPMWGKKHSGEVLEKIREGRKRRVSRPISYVKMAETRRRLYGDWYPDREKTREKMSKARRGKLFGREHPCFKDGRNMIYGQGFSLFVKEQIRLSFGNICVLCLKKNGSDAKQLACHHVNGDKDDHSSENLITLCMKCHKLVHSDEQFWNGTDYLQLERG